MGSRVTGLILNCCSKSRTAVVNLIRLRKLVCKLEIIQQNQQIARKKEIKLQPAGIFRRKKILCIQIFWLLLCWDGTWQGCLCMSMTFWQVYLISALSDCVDELLDHQVDAFQTRLFQLNDLLFHYGFKRQVWGKQACPEGHTNTTYMEEMHGNKRHKDREDTSRQTMRAKKWGGAEWIREEDRQEVINTNISRKVTNFSKVLLKLYSVFFNTLFIRQNTKQLEKAIFWKQKQQLLRTEICRRGLNWVKPNKSKNRTLSKIAKW